MAQQRSSSAASPAASPVSASSSSLFASSSPLSTISATPSASAKRQGLDSSMQDNKRLKTLQESLDLQERNAAQTQRRFENKLVVLSKSLRVEMKPTRVATLVKLFTEVLCACKMPQLNLNGDISVQGSIIDALVKSSENNEWTETCTVFLFMKSLFARVGNDDLEDPTVFLVVLEMCLKAECKRLSKIVREEQPNLTDTQLNRYLVIQLKVKKRFEIKCFAFVSSLAVLLCQRLFLLIVTTVLLFRHLDTLTAFSNS